jgi:hypothetical protein
MGGENRRRKKIERSAGVGAVEREEKRMEQKKEVPARLP